MKWKLWLVAALVVVICLGGCAALQTKDSDKGEQSKAAAALKTLLKLTGALGEGIDKLDKITTGAEKDEQPEAPKDVPVADNAASILKLIAPALPPIAREIALGLGALLPFGVAWWKARGRANERESEEKLLISGLQLLKKHDPAAFKLWVKCRNLAAKGKLKASQLEELLEGIKHLRATIPELELSEELASAA